MSPSNQKLRVVQSARFRTIDRAVASSGAAARGYRNAKRTDVSEKLFHFTTGNSATDSFRTLRNIMGERRSVAANYMIGRDYRCLCFTEALPRSPTASAIVRPCRASQEKTENLAGIAIQGTAEICIARAIAGRIPSPLRSAVHLGR